MYEHFVNIKKFSFNYDFKKDCPMTISERKKIIEYMKEKKEIFKKPFDFSDEAYLKLNEDLKLLFLKYFKISGNLIYKIIVK